MRRILARAAPQNIFKFVSNGRVCLHGFRHAYGCVQETEDARLLRPKMIVQCCRRFQRALLLANARSSLGCLRLPFFVFAPIGDLGAKNGLQELMIFSRAGKTDFDRFKWPVQIMSWTDHNGIISKI